MPVRRLKIAIKDHRRESRKLAGALAAAGHTFVTDGSAADLLLIDLDPPVGLHKVLIDTYAEQGAKVVIYPHGGGGPVLSYEGLFEPDPRVAANLTTGLGQTEFMRRIDYPGETHTIGWVHCDRRPFRPCADVKNILFAPTHPNGDGSIIPSLRERNSEVFEELLKGDWNITVRHLGTLEANGLWEAEGVKYVRGNGTAAWDDIDVADAIVAGDGTFPTLAIARGVPTVVYNQGVVALGLSDEQQVTVPARMHLYGDFIRYPYDAGDGPLDEIVHAAAASEAGVADWKRRFLGEPFDPMAAVEIIERIVMQGPVPVRIDPTRSRTTLAFPDELIARPELLRAYCREVRPADDATLLLWQPGVRAPQLLALAEQAIEGAGLSMDNLPDMLLAPLPGSPEADRVLAERCTAVLTEEPAAGKHLGGLERFAAPTLTAA